MCSLFSLSPHTHTHTHRGGGLPTFHLPPVRAGKPSLHNWSRSSELLQGRKGSLHWRDKVAVFQDLQYVDMEVEGLRDVATCSDIIQTHEGHCPMNNLTLSLTICRRTGGWRRHYQSCMFCYRHWRCDSGCAMTMCLSPFT